MLSGDIGALESLIKGDEIIAPLKYDNPERNLGNFLLFVRDYANLQGKKLIEKSHGPLSELWGEVSDLFFNITSRSRPLDQRFIYGFYELMSLAFKPLWLPLFGVGAYEIEKEDNFIVGVPNFMGAFGGLMFPDRYRSHEYLHVYLDLVAQQLKNEGIITYDIDRDIPWIEPIKTTPTKAELRAHERYFLIAMVKSIKNTKVVDAPDMKTRKYSYCM